MKRTSFPMSRYVLLFTGLALFLFKFYFPALIDRNLVAGTASSIQNSSQQNLAKPMQPDPWIKITVEPSLIKIYPGGKVSPTDTLEFTVIFGNKGTRSMESVVIQCFPPNMSIPVGKAPLTQWGQQISTTPAGIINDPKLTVNSLNPKLLELIEWEISSIPPASETEIDANQIVFTLILDVVEILNRTSASFDLQCWIGMFYKSNLSQPEAFHVVTIRVEIVPDLEIEKNAVPSTVLPGDTTTILLSSKNHSRRDLDDVIITDLFWSSKGNVDQCIEIISIDIPASDNTLPNLEWRNLSYPKEMTEWRRILITVGAKPYEELKSLFRGEPIVISDKAVIIYGSERLDSTTASFQIVARDLVPKLEPKIFGNYASPGFPLLLHTWIKNIGSTPTYEQFYVKIWMNDQRKTPFFDQLIANRIEAGDSLYFAVETPALPEGEGHYKFYFEIDYLNQVSEIVETNNIDSILVTAKLQSLKTTVNNSTWSDRVNILDRSPAFPEPIFSYIQVTDQNYHYIRGLADVNSWSSMDWVTPIGAKVREIWKPIQEYHGENNQVPSVRDISSLNIARIDENFSNGFSVAMIIDANIEPADTSNTNTAARTLIRQMRSQDKMAIIQFSGSVHLATDFTADTAALMNVIQKPLPASNDHRLYDAIFSGIEQTALTHGRKAVFVYTSSPNSGSFHGLNDVIHHADTLGVPVFVFGFGNADQANLKRLAEETGGIFIYEKDTRDMWYIFKLFAEMFKNHYVLAHTTTDTTRDGTWRLVDITVNYPAIGLVDSDIGKYKAPNIGVDLSVMITATTDSFSVGGSYPIQYVVPNEIYSYHISYENQGSIPCYNAVLKNILSKYVDVVPGTFSCSPASTSADQHQLFWQIDSLMPGERSSINFDVQVKKLMPKWQIAIIDSALILHNQDEKPENNISTNIVFKKREDVPPPVIRAMPEKIRPHDPITIELQVFEIFVEWDLLVYFEDGAIVTTYADSFIAPHTPLLPVDSADQWYRIIPDFTDTWKRTDKQQEKIRFKFNGINRDSQKVEAEDTVTVEAEFECRVHPIVIKPAVPGESDRSFIDLVLPKDHVATASIYNVAGELVRKLPETPNLLAGERYNEILSWDGRDDNGNLVASDVYVIVIKAGSNQTSKKVIVIR
ncbi:MAG: VWA domain-containing protein [candidate division KSB1 bacterium]|nr:VWA domain-containing protein [candidate division KSB1 bacterium]MDZ7335325.1 VWA domain-containing protein [candidate division KSB1 bacterium]MDZ7356798.1 VWA domain-containing protein [candidate division KSB1 bacterium]MDZ7399011.1 VWA domain-containing protein [candidate division KSB1 bacterium]